MRTIYGLNSETWSKMIHSEIAFFIIIYTTSMCSICGCEAWNKYIIRYVTDRGMWYVCMYFYFALFRNDYMEDRGAGCVDWVWSSVGRCGQILGGVVKYEEVWSR